MTWKLSAIGGTPHVSLAKTGSGTSDARKGMRRAYFPETAGYVECPVYDRYRLAPGAALAGPGIVEERESTTVLPPGVVATVDEYATLVVRIEPSIH